MESPNQLKNRFEKLQRESHSPKPEDKPAPAVRAVPESVKVELQASSHPEIHEAVRTGQAKSYDWKKQFKQLFVKPAIAGSRSTLMTEVEWSLQSLTQNKVLLSFTHSDQLDLNLLKLANHIKKRKTFWAKVLNSAEHLHIYAEKNKTHLGIRFSTSTNSVKASLKHALEEEYLSGSNTIKTFYMKGQNDWIEIILEISSDKEERRTGEANL